MAPSGQDPAYTVAILKAVSDDAIAALGHPFNSRRLIDTTTGPSPGRRRRSEGTPPVEIKDVSIRLSLREPEKPYDPQKGFVFGSDIQNEKVDVLLHPDPGADGISRLHFSISYDWADKTLILKNFSRLGTKLESASSETTLKHSELKSLSAGDLIRAGFVILKVVIPERQERQATAFIKHLEEYRKECVAAMPRLEAMVMPDSTIVTITESERLKLVKRVGKGGTASVYQAISVSGAYFAVKIFHQSAKLPREMIEREANVLSCTDHPNVVRIFNDKLVDTLEPYLVMEYLELGNLDDHNELTVPQVDAIFRQICSAGTHLHELKITHRDLKPENIMVKSLFPVHITVADFGFASQDVLMTMCGSYLYCAPEIFTLFEQEAYTPKVDVWAVGIIMMEFSTAGPPKDVPKAHSWRIEQWLGALNVWKQEPARSGREHIMKWAKATLIEEPKHRPEMECLANQIDQHMKGIIRDCIIEDSNRKPSVAMCLTTLLDYLSLDASVNSRIVAKSLRGSDSYKVQRVARGGPGRKRDVYVGLEHALGIVSDRAPLMAGLVADVVKEMKQRLQA